MTVEKRRHAQQMQRIHATGYIAREDGEGRAACPYGPALGELELRSWWLAGWHDKDQELSRRWTWKTQPTKRSKQ